MPYRSVWHGVRRCCNGATEAAMIERSLCAETQPSDEDGTICESANSGGGRASRLHWARP